MRRFDSGALHIDPSGKGKDRQMEEYKMSAEAVSRSIKNIEEATDDLKTALEAVCEGFMGDHEAMLISDAVISLSYDADDIDDVFSVGYAERKHEALVSVLGVAHVLASFDGERGSAGISSKAAARLSATLTKAARYLDKHANRGQLFG